MGVKYSVLKFAISGKGGVRERKLGIFKNAKSDELHRRRKRGGPGGGAYPLAPPIIHPPFPSISIRNGKKSQIYQVEG